MKNPDPLALENLRLPDSLVRAGTIAPQKVQKRKKEIFVQISPIWQKRMNGLSGKTQTVARHILERHFENYGRPVKLTNGPLLAIGIGRDAKSQALADLEARGLIEVERHPRKTPVVRPLHTRREQLSEKTP
jgi:hypothetical protein